jgi:nitrogen regulatory protein PII
MKSILITFDQAYYERIVDMLERNNCRGFTAWQEVQGRGSKSGEPHYGSHAWPSLASAIITVVEDHRVDNVLKTLHEMDVETPKLGLRAFVWNIEQSI